MKILVTGVSGFTGGYLARRLIEKGNEVRGLVLPGMETEALKKAGIRIHEGDLRDPDSLKDAVAGVDIVYHIAAVYREQNVPHSLFFEVNHQGTAHMLQAALEAGVRRFVHCSTVGVQGEIKNPPATEDHPYNPGDYYQESKLQGELLALDYFRKRGLPGAVFRPVGIYGPGDTRFLKIFRFIARKKFHMFGSGNVLYHLTYIDDLVEGIILMGETPGIEGEVITLAGERYTTLNEFVETVARVLEVELPRLHLPVWPLWLGGALCELVCRPFHIDPPIYRRRVEFFIKDRAFDISKARRLLNYQPSISLEEGVRRTASWYRDQGLLD